MAVLSIFCFKTSKFVRNGKPEAGDLISDIIFLKLLYGNLITFGWIMFGGLSFTQEIGFVLKGVGQKGSINRISDLERRNDRLVQELESLESEICFLHDPFFFNK